MRDSAQGRGGTARARESGRSARRKLQGVGEAAGWCFSSLRADSRSPNPPYPPRHVRDTMTGVGVWEGGLAGGKGEGGASPRPFKFQVEPHLPDLLLNPDPFLYPDLIRF